MIQNQAKLSRGPSNMAKSHKTFQFLLGMHNFIIIRMSYLGDHSVADSNELTTFTEEKKAVCAMKYS